MGNAMMEIKDEDTDWVPAGNDSIKAMEKAENLFPDGLNYRPIQVLIEAKEENGTVLTK